MSDFDIAIQRLTRLSNDPRTPKAVSGDLALLLVAAQDSKHQAADAELGQLVRKMPDGYTLANVSDWKGPNWNVDNFDGYTVGGGNSPEQALKAALQTEGVEQMESRD